MLALSMLFAPLLAVTNIAPAAEVTTDPAWQGSTAMLVDGRLSAGAFAVGTKGPGSVALGWTATRTISQIRVFQGSDIYRMDSLFVEIEGSHGWKQVNDVPLKTPLKEWATLTFEPPVQTRAIRIGAVEGKAGGARAYPCFAEIQVIGEPLAGDSADAVRQGHAMARLSAAKPARRETALVSGGQPPAILAPADPAAQAVAKRLAEALAKRLGVTPVVAKSAGDLPLGQATVIALGTMLDNELLTRLYFNHYTFEDARFPGAGGYTVHTVYDPYPWGGGQDVIVLGGAEPAQLDAAATRWLGVLTGEGAATRMPYTLLVEPKPQPTPAERKLLDGPVDPSFTDFRVYAEKYLQSGEEAYAKRALAALDIMAAVYEKDPERHVPWPEETTSGAINATWDAFEECPLITPERRTAYTNAFLCFTRRLVPNTSDYGGINDQATLAWNHTTFPLLGIYFGARYFDRYYHLPETKEWLTKARQCFTAQARSWKPQEDADSYLILTMGHMLEYCLAEWDLRFFRAGLMKQYADYIVACGDNRQWPSGFGDSGVSAAPTMALAVLPLAWWWTHDGAYRGVLERVAPKGWVNPYGTAAPADAGDRFLGVQAFRLDPQLYAYTQAQPFYNEPLAKADVPANEAYDKIAFRESWRADGQYLLLDGFGRGKHLHYDTNGITEFVQDGERWLLDHDYLVRNTTEHTMLSVLRDGRGDQLVPSMAGLARQADLPGFAAVDTYVRGYNGVDWQRRLLWRKGRWFLIHDTVTARQPGEYDLELTWKTIDRGHQQVDPQGRFTAFRGTADGNYLARTVADKDAANGQAVLLSEQASRLVFTVDLPAGDCQVTLTAYGADTSSDSLWLSVDDGEPVAFHLAKGTYGPSAGNADHSQASPHVSIAKAGRHVVRVTLRESPPVRLDKLVFTPAGAAPVTVEAETAPAPRPDEVKAEVPSAMHLDPAMPVEARVTNHVRTGIVVPVSIYHQRRSRPMKAGDATDFCSLLYATDGRHTEHYQVAALRDHVWAVTGSKDRAVAGDGPDACGRWAIDAEAWLVEGGALTAAGVRRLKLGAGEQRFDPAADLTLAGGKLTLTGPSGPADQPLGALEPAALADVAAPAEHVAAPVPPPAAPGVPPAWTTDLGTGTPVYRVTPIDLDGDGRAEYLVAVGNDAVCVGADGQVRWRFATQGEVRDIAPLRVAKGAAPSLLVSSADTHLYVLDANGQELRKRQMVGIYFSADHGERPWPLWCTRGVDTDGDGVDDLVVTTLKSMEALGLDPQTLDKRWRTLAAYHGAMDIDVRDVDGDGKPEIGIADKYGAVYFLKPDGRIVGRSYTSIGDSTFALGDLDGDGRLDVVHGGSTGDLRAGKLAGDDLWRFDNFGYPVNRIVVAELTRGAGASVLVAAGSGRLYCLDGHGQVRWQRRLGFAVTDVAVVGREIVAATQDGDLLILDAAGRELARLAAGAGVTRLATAGGRVVAGTENGRLVALPEAR